MTFGPAFPVDAIIKVVLLLFFLIVYGFTAVIGVSIFLHFRWFGLADRSEKLIEGLFIITSIVIFIWNIGLLFSF